MVRREISQSAAREVLISPIARNGVRGIGWLCSLFVIIVALMVERSTTIFLIFVLFAQISMVTIYVVTDRKRKYYFPVVFILFYLVGYMFSLPYLLLTKHKLSAVGWFPIGTFGFSEEEWLRILLVIIFGLAGLLSAVVLCETVNKPKRIRNNKIAGILYGKRNRGKLWIFLWFIFSVSVIVTMIVLDIGKHGVAESRVLPFKLIGILVYTRNFIVPFFGFLLIDTFVRNNEMGLCYITIFLLLGISLITSIVFLARGFFALPVVGLLLYFIINSGKYGIKSKVVSFYALLAIPVLGMSMVIVTSVRTVVYHGKGSIEGAVIESMKLYKSVSFLLWIVALRVEGIRLLFAVDSSALSGLKQTWGWFISAPESSLRITENIFGWVPGGAGHAFGVTLGIWGWLYLSKSYLIVFVGTVLLTSFVLFIEELFQRKGLCVGALFFGLYVGVFVWMNMVWFFMTRIFAMVMVAYMVTRLIEARYIKHQR